MEKIRILETIMRNWMVISFEMFIIGFAVGNLFHIWMDKRYERKRKAKISNIDNDKITEQEIAFNLELLRKERNQKEFLKASENTPFNTNPHNIYGHRY